MASIITPPENVGVMPSLGLEAIGSLRQALEEAIAMTMRGEATSITIVAAIGAGKGVKTWAAGNAESAHMVRWAVMDKPPLMMLDTESGEVTLVEKPGPEAA